MSFSKVTKNSILDLKWLFLVNSIIFYLSTQSQGMENTYYRNLRALKQSIAISWVK